jgi:DNA-repair protein XRCC1
MNLLYVLLLADFASDIAKQKWDRVRVICRQPFRRKVQMGLSFVRIKSPQNEGPCSQKGTDNTPKSVKSIQKHFFGKLSPR